MKQLLAPALEHLVPVSLLTFLCCAVIGVVIARGRARFLITGLIKILISLLSTPFICMKRSVLAIVEFGQSADMDVVHDRPYVLRRFLVMLEAISVLVPVGILVMGMTLGWQAFLPPKEYRNSLNEAKDDLKRSTQALDEAKPKVELLNREWAIQKDSLSASFRKSREERLTAAQEENRSIGRSLSADPDLARVFQSFQSYMSANESYSDQALSARHYLMATINGPDHGNLPDEARVSIVKYVENWLTQVTVRQELRELSEETLRNKIQPEFYQHLEKVQSLPAHIESQKQLVAALERSKHYNPRALLKKTILAVLLFMVAIWSLGILVEILGVWVDMGSGIHTLGGGAHRA